MWVLLGPVSGALRLAKQGRLVDGVQHAVIRILGAGGKPDGFNTGRGFVEVHLFGRPSGGRGRLTGPLKGGRGGRRGCGIGVREYRGGRRLEEGDRVVGGQLGVSLLGGCLVWSFGSGSLIIVLIVSIIIATINVRRHSYLSWARLPWERQVWWEYV